MHSPAGWAEANLTASRAVNPPDMSDPKGLSDLGGGTVNNDGRFVDGSGTALPAAVPHDELYQ